ncbi:M48 family metallopeptidase [Caldivirga maquilingensis]|uniref:Peptidase M48 Ste24p n=1 Tax=Caldivirga maquilingensis (strain ATCC 700844 / DSM 13496 / JCM 10307 / IC-167) TaxID=397948 RepID=A8MAE0_CALMQ|nr:M48 family metallopeptidase [Caldivirga maquilingensis]ABW02517.1 peptidase M48 Ste24p [Caldivirga maquilingensis IC-167]
MRAYSKLLDSLMRLGSIKVSDIMRNLSTGNNNDLLYVIYSLNSDISIEAYFTRFYLAITNGSLRIRGDLKKADEFSKIMLRNTVIGNGRKLVMLFKDNGEEYVKIPTRPTSSITMNPAVSFIVSSILTLIIFLLLTKYGILLTLAVVIAQVLLTNIAYTYVSFLRMIKLRVNGSNIIKVVVTLPIDVPEDTLARLVSYASSIKSISKSQLTLLISGLRAIGGSMITSINVERISMPLIKGINVYLVPSPECNAVSLNLINKVILVSTKLVACLNEDELRAVIHHELGHIINKDTYKALVASVVYSLVSAVMLLYVIPRIGLTLVTVSAYALIALLAIVISLTLSRINETKADLYALSKGYKESLATALVKVTYPSIHSPLIKQVFLSHPTTLSRVNAILKASKRLNGK